MITLCQFGAGRIGAIHAANAAAHPAVRLRYIVDVQSEAASALAARHGAEVCEPDKALRDQQVNAVLIASSTDTHADLLEAAARAGKAIFCEKPIDLSLARVDACLREVARCKVPLLVGFNRRHDPNFKALHTALAAGEAGKLEMVSITSRDPAPPPLEYVKVSGGLFRDMMIHDFDMARWLLPEEPCEVMAMASCLVDSSIGEAGDVDTAMVTLKTPGGVLCHIGNSRRAVYGYDQRIEVFGSKGMLQAGNQLPTTLRRYHQNTVAEDAPLYFFLERYTQAYRNEMDHFVAVVENGIAPETGAADGRQALVLAEAALESLRTGRPVSL